MANEIVEHVIIVVLGLRHQMVKAPKVQIMAAIEDDDVDYFNSMAWISSERRELSVSVLSSFQKLGYDQPMYEQAKAVMWVCYPPPPGFLCQCKSPGVAHKGPSQKLQQEGSSVCVYWGRVGRRSSQEVGSQWWLPSCVYKPWNSSYRATMARHASLSSLCLQLDGLGRGWRPFIALTPGKSYYAV